MFLPVHLRLVWHWWWTIRGKCIPLCPDRRSRISLSIERLGLKTKSGHVFVKYGVMEITSGYLFWLVSICFLWVRWPWGSLGCYQRRQWPFPPFTSCFDAGNPAFLHTAPFVPEWSGCRDEFDPGMGGEDGKSPETSGLLASFNI